MDNDGIEITIEEYGKSHVIAFVEKNDKSMMLIFGLYDFVENMEFGGINVVYGSKNGREGLIFDNAEIIRIRTEIELFIYQYNLTKYNP